MWELDHKENWALKKRCFWIVVLEKTLESLLNCKEIKSVNQEISPEYSLEVLMLKLKLHYFGHLMRKAWLIGKDPDAGTEWRWEEKGTIEDEMFGWHHWLKRHKSEQTPGDGEGQGGLACCSPWGHKESDMTWLRDWSTTASCFYVI